MRGNQPVAPIQRIPSQQIDVEVAEGLANTDDQQDRLKQQAEKYITGVTRRLGRRELLASIYGQLACVGGLCSLIAAVVSAIKFTAVDLDTRVNDIARALAVVHAPIAKDTVPFVFLGTLAYYACRGLIVVGILVAISKYLFNLGKAWMTVSLRNADRIHAISFGDFYIATYLPIVSPEDVRKVFETWNIDTNATFAQLDANDHDPKMFDKAMQLAGKAIELVKATGDSSKNDSGDSDK